MSTRPRSNPTGDRLASLGALAGAAYLALLIASRLDLADRADQGITELVQSRPSTTLDGLADAYLIIGDPLVTSAVALGLSGWIFLRRDRGSFAFLAPGLILLTSGVELASKMSLLHPPPPASYVRAAFHMLTTGLDPNIVSSFPSGHVARVAFLAVLGSALTGKRSVQVALAVLASLTIPATVYLGWHWASDAFGGLLLGSGIGVVGVGWSRSAATRA